MVVFPALSRPLSRIYLNSKILIDVDDLQKQQPHLLLLLPVLPDYSEQTHKKVAGKVAEMIQFGTAVTGSNF